MKQQLLFLPQLQQVSYHNDAVAIVLTTTIVCKCLNYTVAIVYTTTIVGKFLNDTVAIVLTTTIVGKYF